MQTFLPCHSFAESAMVLDFNTLCEQRRHVFELLDTLCGFSSKWKEHPITDMWRDHKATLLQYGYCIHAELRSRGIKDWDGSSILNQFSLLIGPEREKFPKWLGDPLLHMSHQSNLIRRWPEYYRLVFPGVPNNLPYYWPIGEMV